MSSSDITNLIQNLEDGNVDYVDIINFIPNELETDVVDEQQLLKALTCHALSFFVPYPSNGELMGPASAGKTTALMKILRYFPSRYIKIYESISPQALRYGADRWYDKGTDEDVTSVYLKLKSDWENDKLEKKSENSINISKAIREFEEAHFKCNNLENKLIIILENPGLNTLKQFRCFLEHDDWFIVSKSVYQGKQTEMNIRGWPGLIYCTADGIPENVDKHLLEQVESRFNTLHPTTSPDKIKKILNLKANKRCHLVDPNKFKKDLTNINLVKKTIDFLVNKIMEHKEEYLTAGASRQQIDLVINPFGEDINKMFPMKSHLEARIEKQMANLMEVITLSRLFKRPYVMVDGLTQYLSVREDYDTIRELIEHFKFSTHHDINETKFIEHVIMPAFFPEPPLEDMQKKELWDGGQMTHPLTSKSNLNKLMRVWDEFQPVKLEMFINKLKKDKIIETKKGPGGGYQLNCNYSTLKRIINHEYVIPTIPEHHLENIQVLMGDINKGIAVLYIDNEPHDSMEGDEIEGFIKRYY